mgnify:CR=1 FL=1|tara:strand:+ start:5648 stop:7039 length:1392 start_codon:yes stop_codon:yes gene_type:complete
MKTLFPPQQEALDFFTEVLRDGRSTLDSSQMGTGKTVVGAQIAKDLIDNSLNLPQREINNVAVICPKAVTPSWQRELRECGLNPLFVLNVEKLRTGKTDYVSKTGSKSFRWNIPKDTLVLVDEIHQLKGPWTLNAGLLVSLIQNNYLVHGMSGTPCDSPMEMRSIGYMLGLHSNTNTIYGRPNYWKWLRQMKCTAGFHGGFEMKDPEFALSALRKSMYGVTTHGLTVSDFPDSFRGNRVIVDPIEFSRNDKIIKAYEKLDMTESHISDYIQYGRIPDHLLEDGDDKPMITRIGEARQECEILKVPDIRDQAHQAMQEGYSVAIFLNYTASIEELSSLLKCDYINGEVPQLVRNNLIKEFQDDKSHCLVLNSATGGTGISLHDTHGERPRVSLISPSFNAKEFSQVLGRIHRNGAKTDALQKVLLADGSIEEYVMQAINRKMKNMDAIHHSQICEFSSSYYTTE